MKITKVYPGITVRLDLDKLTMIQKALGAKNVTHVGILGAKSHSRKEAGKLIKKAGKFTGGHSKTKEAADQTNADIGFLHEKGSKSLGIERRSFLLMPLEEQSLELNSVRNALWQSFTEGRNTIVQAYRKLGQAAEAIIQKAFETGGYGHWDALKAKTIARKKSSSILIDTAQLRRSITSRVVSK